MVITTRLSHVVTAGGSLPVCAGCKQRIYDEQYLQALNSDWHTVCFRYCSAQTAEHSQQIKPDFKSTHILKANC